jgi:hypothetical protein
LLSGVRYTTKNGTVYAMLLKYPDAAVDKKSVALSAPNATVSSSIRLLGYDGVLNWAAKGGGGVVIDLSNVTPSQLKSNWAWVFKLINFK